MRTEPLYIVPGILDGELLSSYWRRLCEVNCRQSVRSTTSWLFSAPWRLPDHLLPGYLGLFAQQVGRLVQIPDPSCWLRNHTQFALFAAGLPPQRQDDLRRRMLHTKGGPIAPCIALTSAEALRATVAICPRCDRQAVEAYGIPYWHRIHNAPGVSYCLIHGCPLNRVVTHADRAPVMCVERTRRTALKVDNALRLAQASASLSQLCGAPLNTFRQQLRLRASIAGTGRPTARLRYGVIADLVREAYRGGFESSEVDALVSSAVQVQSWLKGLFQSRARVHPVHVALLHGAFELLSSDQPAAKPSELLQPARPSIDVDSCLKVLREQRTLTQASQRLGLSVTTLATIARRHDIPFESRPSVLIPKVRARICGWLATGESIGAIAQKAGVSRESVYRILAGDVQVKAKRRAAVERRARDSHRARWRQACNRYPGLSLKQLRQKAPAQWSWLYRHDRTWLREHLAARLPAQGVRQVRPPRVRLPWEEITRQVLRALGVARDRLVRTPSAARATQQRLLAAVGAGTDDLRRAPAIENALARLAESDRQFVERRLKQALDQARSTGASRGGWSMIRIAGLRSSTIEKAGIEVACWLRLSGCDERLGAAQVMANHESSGTILIAKGKCS